jgi:serine/threonine protein kinase/formylglycine-generating enzyme required for sulfatase activity
MRSSAGSVVHCLDQLLGKRESYVSDVPTTADASRSLSTIRQMEEVCDDFEVELSSGKRPRIEDYLQKVNESQRPSLLRQLLSLELAYLAKTKGTLDLKQYQQRFPEHAELVKLVISDEDADLPTHLGRYRVTAILGHGGFGIVYKAYDEELKCERAIKVPKPKQAPKPAFAEIFLAEARAVARLDHPNIVSVHDVGQTADGLPFVVYKYIPGGDLKQRMQQGRMPFSQSAELVAIVAEALHHAHLRGVCHRDVKPGNLLIDNAGKPCVADFGLALQEEDFGKGPEFAGTLAYSSPEQARYEGHRVDGRSDVFSLGVVLYELLTGRRPFQAATRSELKEQIIHVEPRPLRQIDDRIPKELERVCLKALAKKVSDRYLTAMDLKEDLRYFLDAPAKVVGPPTTPQVENAAQPPPPDPVKVVPQGIRSFDAADAYFFVELLPGPRDRDGLPDSIRFWKTRIEERDPELAFTVGLIYGPSGCGKSSLVKAGLLPRLAGHVIALYVEATAGETEARLLKGLRKNCPDLPPDLTLVDTLAALRRGRGIPPGSKVLIVLDQFEQWLHSHPALENSQLVRALRQCDGGRMQCLVMVRDDFWMAATRFFREMEVRLVEAQNSGVVDLFDVRHARKILALFGEAAGALPQEAGARTQEQNAFLDEAVAGLAQAEKIICVRLAVFAEMVKGKSWTPELLGKLGGAAGVVTTFLEETFAAASAPPEHRYHQEAARLVLKALLPEAGGDIKGQMRSYTELLTISGYFRCPRDFDDLLRILDAELRLITPTEPDSKQGDGDTASTAEPRQKYYQLTHDYLVHPLRDWLTRKQKEKWRGRGQLRLEERTSLWNPRREGRFLPSLPEYLHIWASVPARLQSPQQRALMRTARKRHGLVWGGFGLGLLIAGCAFLLIDRRNEERRAKDAVDLVVKAAPGDVQAHIRDLLPLRVLARDRLQAIFEGLDSTHRLHAAFALAALDELDEVKTAFLLEAIPTSPPREAENLIAALSQAPDVVSPKLRQRVEAETNPEHRARYAITLLHLGDATGAEQVLEHAPDPKFRTAFIHGFERWHSNLAKLTPLLKAKKKEAFRSGMSVALGLVPRKDLGEDERNSLVPVLTDWYLNARDGGTHGAAGWALQKWGAVPLPAVPPPAGARPGCDWPGYDWFVNGHGLTMVKVPSGEFTMGFRPTPMAGAGFANAPPHEVTLSQSFCMADRPIPVRLFNKFVGDPNAQAAKAQWSDDYPQNMVTWKEAILFCNWLSKEENRQTCYTWETNTKNGNDTTTWAWNRQANGYRLPTEAEWEYACRAGTTTMFSFGDDGQLLPEYGIVLRNSKRERWPGATRLPNAWGLFDLHGNITVWCWDWYAPDFVRGEKDPQGPSTGDQRVVRGGNYYTDLETDCASAMRYKESPERAPYPLLGIRVVCGWAGAP